MSNIQQRCPSCHRLLELPAGATGRLAKCPACEATFTVGAASSDESFAGQLPTQPRQAGSTRAESAPPGAAETDAAGTDAAGTDAAGTPASVLPPYGAPQSHAEAASASDRSPGETANPFCSPLESGMAAEPVNPYLPSQFVNPVAKVGKLQIVSRSIEEIFSPTLSIFAARWGTLLLAFVFVLIASFAVIVVPMFVLAAIADAASEAVAVIGLMMLLPLMGLFSCYISVALARNATAVARNSPSPLMELFPPLVPVVRFLVGGIAIGIVSGVAVGLFAGLIVILVAIGGNEGLVTVLVAIGAFLLMAAAMAAYWVLWAWMFIVSDGTGTALGSIKAAYTLTMNNKLTSVLLIVIATVLSTAGTSACYIGLLVTQPLSNLMFAVAYLLMTNQAIDDPRDARQSYPAAQPPQQPVF